MQREFAIDSDYNQEMEKETDLEKRITEKRKNVCIWQRGTETAPGEF